MKRLRRLLDLPQRPPGGPQRKVRFRKHLDETTVGELVAMYGAGATVYDLAEVFGIHRETVSRIVKRAGLETRYHERTPVDLGWATELQAQGLTITEIARRMGIGRTTLVIARRRARQG